MKKILVISDIHANLSALQTVLQKAGSVDETWCLGDLIGYGPDPNECIETIAALPNMKCLLGNHDAAATGQIDLSTFNREAGISSIWTRQQLNPQSMAFLKSLPDKLVVSKDVTLVHGSPRNPVWEYLLDIFSATENFSFFETQICLVGHTHLPLAYLSSPASFADLVTFQNGDTIQVKSKTIINPGSVGQPRDHDPRAAYALFFPDDFSWESHRVEYDFEITQERILQAKLPRHHAERLAQGW